MKNLKLDDAWKCSFVLEGEPCSLCFGYDSTEQRASVYISDHNLSISKHDLCASFVSWTRALPELAEPDAVVVNLTYLILSSAVTVGVSSGEIWTIQSGDGTVEEAGVCAGGLAAMEWSPDQELVVLVSKKNQMILMSYLFDPITEENLAGEEFGQKSFVTVGWGKKETQFHGTEGKQAARAKTEIVVGDTENTTPKITWRADGQLYAVGVVINGIRIFKVFDRDGKLQYTSEKQSGLEENLAWRPSGNLIASTQKLPNKYVVVFFEKNGLKHGDFTIPLDANNSVEDLSWSCDSEIIALKCYDSEKKVDSILLFAINNYHWYLKQTITFTKGERIVKLMWDNEENTDLDTSKKLHILSTNATMYSYTWSWTINHSKGRSESDDGLVAVIDGNKVLVTAFRQSVIPPPMCSVRLELEENVNFVFFGPSNFQDDSWGSNSLFICTESKLVSYKQTSKKPLKYLKTYAKTIKNDIPLGSYNWCVLGNNVVCVSYGDDYFLREYNLNQSENIELLSSVQLDSGVWDVQVHPEDNTKLHLLTKSEVREYSNGKMESKLSVRPGTVRLSTAQIEGKLYFFTLTYKNSLSINDNETVLSHVSSIFIHSHFLLLTTLQHELLCIELTSDALKALIDHAKVNTSHIYKRKVERGSSLVVAVPCDTRVVLQLPRGNLEAIQPRPLSLKIIGDYLDQCKYFAAFDLMRKQRINLNLIHDHNPERFHKNLDTFLREIKNPSWLSLFLSDLENINVTTSMYASSYASNSRVTTSRINNKVKETCDTIRIALEAMPDCDEKILPILTCFVKKNTLEDLEKALYVVKEIKTKENTNVKVSIGSDEALRYLLYLVDVNSLFDIALGMYDFDLVMLVANKSQKDPKEYVPMLNELNDMEENYRRFSVNKTLKRFDRAVEYLVKCGPDRHEELRTFVKYHSLFRRALELLNCEEKIYKEISEDYGLYLKLNKHYTEAGFVYSRGGNLQKAVECFKDALEWQLAIQLASDWPEEKLQELCRELVRGLRTEKLHTDALCILEQYCTDKVESIKYSVETCHFRTAFRLCQKYGSADLADTLIRPAVEEELKNMQDTINTNSETFRKHKTRLAVARENKKMKENEDGVDFMNKDSDLYSDAGSTVASTGSRDSNRSFKSSKNRRKHERKLVSLKEGSRYEDLALVNALHALVSTTFELRASVREVNLALCWLGRDLQAGSLQRDLENTLKQMKESFKEIWSNEFMLEAANATLVAQDTEGTPQGLAALDLHIRIPPVIQELDWKLEAL